MLAQSLALVGGTIFTSPTSPAIRDGVVLIDDGRVVAVGDRRAVDVPAGADTLDCSGRTIVAGFWNSHVHFFERKWASAGTLPARELERQLEEMLTRYGFTSAFDTGSPWENTRALRDRIDSGQVLGPRILSTGETIIARGALPPDTVFRVMGLMMFPAPEITTPAEAAAASRTLLDAGVDAIKLHLQPPPPPQPPFPEEGLAKAAGEARRSRRPVFVHPHTGADVLAAIRAGVDVIAHTTPGSGPWEETLFAAMKDRFVALTPTLTLWKQFLRHDRITAQETMVATAVEQLRAWRTAGGAVLFGTDLGAVDYDPTDEYVLMAEAGMSFEQILESLTIAPAAHFGRSETSGRIAPGYEADLVVLAGDPSRDLRALAAVKYTLRAGRIVHPLPDTMRR